MQQDQPRYRCFTRTWWAENPAWPNGLEPCAGKKRYLKGAKNLSFSEAQQVCKDWNAKHKPGRLSLKAEFEQQ